VLDEEVNLVIHGVGGPPFPWAGFDHPKRNWPFGAEKLGENHTVEELELVDGHGCPSFWHMTAPFDY
jgi:hypothetical protein